MHDRRASIPTVKDFIGDDGHTGLRDNDDIDLQTAAVLAKGQRFLDEKSSSLNYHHCGETAGGNLTSFGATIPIQALEAAPEEMEMVWPPVANTLLTLPEAVRNATGFQVLTVFWEAHGHPPGPYLTPHFDFHFYGISKAEIEAIDCVDVSKPAALAASYELPDVEIPGLGMLPGLCVPKMGMHSLPAEELHGTDPFQKTMVVDYFRGSPIFMEPISAVPLALNLVKKIS